jgi:hypothetical protein
MSVRLLCAIAGNVGGFHIRDISGLHYFGFDSVLLL